MSDHSSEDPKWLDEFEDLANRELDEGSSCEQIHPIIERWFQRLMEGEPPQSRDSVMQAMACLSTEVLYNSPDDLIESLMANMSEDDLATWIEHILLVGRAFEIALRNGELDDL
ncbi:MAG: hypothetical protein HZC41_03015 [Chloroflexi bacterium]|nr:hypothetical protein [Chloroflexota bacterium]